MDYNDIKLCLYHFGQFFKEGDQGSLAIPPFYANKLAGDLIHDSLFYVKKPHLTIFIGICVMTK